MIAAQTTTAIITGRDTWPRLAATPPSTATVSPGTTKPTNSASSTNTSRPTSPYTAKPCSPSSQSVNRVMTAAGSSPEVLGAVGCRPAHQLDESSAGVQGA